MLDRSRRAGVGVADRAVGVLAAIASGVLRTLLEDLLAQWVRLGAPVVRALRPGLTDAELDAVSSELDLELPNELRELWSWHDGCDRGGNGNIGPGGYQFLSSSDAIEAYRLNRRIHGEDPGDLPSDPYWRRSWVPFMTQDAQRLYIDCDRTTTTRTSPVRLVSWEWENFDVDIAPSLASAVSMWIWLLESDYYAWDPAGFITPVAWGQIPMFARWTLA